MTKKPWDLYLKLKKYKGKKILTTNEIRKIFGYSNGSSIDVLLNARFIDYSHYKHPKKFWILLNNTVAVLRKDIPESLNNYIIDDHSSGKTKLYWSDAIFDIILDSNNQQRFLINEDELPFWKLKKYGGYII